MLCPAGRLCPAGIGLGFDSRSHSSAEFLSPANTASPVAQVAETLAYYWVASSLLLRGLPPVIGCGIDH